MDPSQHPIEHLVEAFSVGGVSLIAHFLCRNRVIRRRMIFTLTVVAGLVLLHFASGIRLFAWTPTVTGALDDIERMLLTLGALNTLVALSFNPWFSDRVRDRAPAIVQDALVIGLFLAAVLIVYPQDATKMLMTSAIAAAVLGFALQETLGNAFAGLAIQTEKPFLVGHWVSVGDFEGRVVEVTWRATKIRTDEGNLVVLPNNVVARDPIVNFTEPTAPTRLFIDVGATYAAPPNAVREAMLAALHRSTRYVLSSPEPDVLVLDFAASAITYRARFWLHDKQDDDEAQDEVRTAIYYEFARRGIEIPYPIQVQYERQELIEGDETRVNRYAAIIGRVPVLAALFVEGRRALAAGAAERMFAAGEVIVEEGAPGTSMFVVCRGMAVVTIGKDHEVARLKEGNYFGEMSLLTGDPRSATVKALGDCTALEIRGDAFREYVITHPQVIEHLATAAVERRRELDQSRAAAAAAIVPEAPMSLAARMRKFFGLV